MGLAVPSLGRLAGKRMRKGRISSFQKHGERIAAVWGMVRLALVMLVSLLSIGTGTAEDVKAGRLRLGPDGQPAVVVG